MIRCLVVLLLLVGAYLIYFASHPRLDIHDIRRIEAGCTRAIDLLDQWHPDLAAAFPYQTRQSRIDTCMDKARATLIGGQMAGKQGSPVRDKAEWLLRFAQFAPF